MWDNVFETILRLKGNMIVPGTWIFPDDAQVEAAAKRGLIINQHHAIPLGVNVARWPKDVPYNFSTHPEILERAWTNAVATYKPDEEILWSVGLRGLSDSSYASLDPSVRDNDPLLGQRISDAIAEQMKIVRAKYPNAQFVTDLWQEGARLMQKGYLHIPPEVTLVWADTGYGDMQDGGKVAAGQGAYFHVAMMNVNANQLSEMVPVSVIQEELGRYIKAGATAYILVNTSDIRPVAMTTRALMETAWGGVAADDHRCRHELSIKRWATEEFGAKPADAIAGIYKEYFAAPSHAKFRSAAGAHLGRKCTAASACATPEQCSARKRRPALPLRNSPTASRSAERRPGGEHSQPVAQVDAAAIIAGVQSGDAACAPEARHRRMRRIAAALGCRVDPRSRSEGTGRRGPERLLPGRGSDDDHD